MQWVYLNSIFKKNIDLITQQKYLILKVKCEIPVYCPPFYKKFILKLLNIHYIKNQENFFFTMDKILIMKKKFYKDRISIILKHKWYTPQLQIDIYKDGEIKIQILFLGISFKLDNTKYLSSDNLQLYKKHSQNLHKLLIKPSLLINATFNALQIIHMFPNDTIQVKTDNTGIIIYYKDKDQNIKLTIQDCIFILKVNDEVYININIIE